MPAMPANPPAQHCARRRHAPRLAATALRIVLLASATLLAGTAQAWLYSGGDAGGTRYSNLQQINRDNVGRMELAWTARSGEHQLLPAAAYADSNMQSTPILLPAAAGQHLVVCSANNYLVALDPETGEQRWRYDPRVPLVKRGITYKCRGNAAYWEDANATADAACKHRLFMGTLDRRLVAVDARNGQPCAGFGNNGQLNLLRDDEVGYSEPMVFSTSQPVVIGDRIVIGSSVRDLVYQHTPAGTINAYDARSGAQDWTFHIVPRDPADPAAASWPENAGSASGAANAWAPLSVDAHNGLVFVPTSSPSPDFYGGYRKGDNRYANSLVALDAQTGKPVWHYQFVHHDLWDYDTPAQPIVIDLNWKNTRIPAVIQLTKQGMVFAFNRLTGEPIIPVEERPVPASTVPGEAAAPTQPFSTLPPLVRHRVGVDDVWGFTPLDKWLCQKSFADIVNEGIYTPPAPDRPTMHFPSEAGGANWGGGAVSPDGLLLVNMMDVAQTLQVTPIADVPREALDGATVEQAYGAGGFTPIRGSDFAFEKRAWMSPLGVPCVAPPWNKVVAVDLAEGKVKWEAPLGSIHDLAPFPVPFRINGFGAPGLGSGVLTAGGLFVIGATSDSTLRAFDVATGEVLWEHDLPVDAMSGVATYQFNGRQYFVTTAGGHSQLARQSGDYIIAFRLPD